MKALITISIAVLFTGCTFRMSPDPATDSKFQAVEKWSVGVYQSVTNHEERIRALEVKAKIPTPTPAPVKK